MSKISSFLGKKETSNLQFLMYNQPCGKIMTKKLNEKLDEIEKCE